MQCTQCQRRARRFGKNRNGSQRFRCDVCRLTFTDAATRPQDGRCLPQAKGILCLRLLLEGNSIRSVERITGVHRDTIIALMVESGERCQAFLEQRIRNVSARNVQVDELWGFVRCKQKTANRKGYGETVGDSWCFAGIERKTKLVLAWHLGHKRDYPNALEFAGKLRRAVAGNFQLTTDGLQAYQSAVGETFPAIDYAQLIKIYGVPADDRRYSPMEVIDTIVVRHSGNPDPNQICTSHIERQNRTFRMQIRRLTRLTDAHSKKWANHEAALALFIAYYNFCRVHSTIRCTPAVKAGLTDEAWSLERLLDEAAKCVK